MPKIQALRIQPGKAPERIWIDNSLKALQHEVGGLIQAVYPYDDPVALICNEEGKVTDLPYNRPLHDKTGSVYDIIAGMFLITGLTEESFDSLMPELASKYKAVFHTPGRFLAMDGRHLLVLPVS